MSLLLIPAKTIFWVEGREALLSAFFYLQSTLCFLLSFLFYTSHLLRRKMGILKWRRTELFLPVIQALILQWLLAQIKCPVHPFLSFWIGSKINNFNKIMIYAINMINIFNKEFIYKWKSLKLFCKTCIHVKTAWVKSEFLRNSSKLYVNFVKEFTQKLYLNILIV